MRTNRPSSQSPTPEPHPSDSIPQQPLWWDQEPGSDRRDARTGVCDRVTQKLS